MRHRGYYSHRRSGSACAGRRHQVPGVLHTPDPLPAGKPGDLIRSEPARLVYEPSGQLGSWVATGTRIMYRSTDAKGNPVAATGMYLEPDNPWPAKDRAP